MCMVQRLVKGKPSKVNALKRSAACMRADIAELRRQKWREGKAINADDHRPIYLKKSQAEQEREAGIYTKGSLRPGESGTQAKIC